MKINNNYKIKFKDDDTYTYVGKLLGIDNFANSIYLMIKIDNYNVEIDMEKILNMEEI